MSQLCDNLFLLIGYLRSILNYKLLLDTYPDMCLACGVAVGGSFTFGYCRNGTCLFRSNFV